LQGYVAVFREALAKHGWIEGPNLLIDLRFGDGDVNGIRAQAAELVKLTPEVIVTYSGTATRAVQPQTQTIPIVVAMSGNNTFQGASAANIARPQGNVTGFAVLYPSIAGKWLQFLKEIAPNLSRVAVVGGTSEVGILDDLGGQDLGGQYLTPIEAAAQLSGVKVTLFPNAAELERAIDAFAAEPNGGLVVLPGATTGTRVSRQSMLLLATRHRLPAIHWDRLYPAEGGLMSYGSDLSDLSRRAAGYVNRLLHGSKVSDLPVQFPTKFAFVLNMKAARALGLTVPPTLLALADEVIE
jgi:putative ABC transport system substrate-binding protein